MAMSSKALSMYQEKIYKILEKKINSSSNSQVIYFEGGHFDPRVGATSFSENSLFGVIEIANNLILQFGKKVKIVFGILIDDLGINCEEEVCEITQKTQLKQLSLPVELEDILRLSKIVKRDRVIISSERNSKNRSIKYLKKILNQSKDELSFDGLIEIHYEDSHSGNIRYISDLEQSIALAKFRGNVWNSKCPSIMAIHYKDVFKSLENRFYKGEYDFTVVDVSEIMDRNKVNMGAEVFLRLVNEDTVLRNNEIINVFFCDDKANRYFIDKKSVFDYQKD